MSTSSDPERGGQEPDDRSREGQSAGGPVPPPGGQPTAGGPEQPGQYQPGQYPPGQYPQPGQYGQYGQYGQPGQPGQYGQYDQPGQPGQYGPPGLYDPHQPPSHGQPYGDRGGYVYSPYGTMPAGLPENDENAPVSRPGIMVLALVLLVLSALPWLLAGVSALANPDPLVPFIVTPEQFDQLRAQGVEPASVVRVLGTVLLIGALLYTMFAALAFSGRNWARIVLAIMTAGFTLLLLGSAVLASAAELGIVLIVVIAAVAGTVILFLPGPSRYITARRR